jgi:hypothetical protein
MNETVCTEAHLAYFMGNEFSVSIPIEGTVNHNKRFHTTLIHETQGPRTVQL